MATSGTTTRTFAVTELLEEAWERATQGDSIKSGYEFKTAKRSLELLLLEWSNQGFNLWTIEQETIALVAGTATYALPTDTVDIFEHTIRTGSGTSQVDVSISPINAHNYANIANKNVQGKPSSIFIDRQLAPQVTLYPVPDQAYTLVIWKRRRIEDVGTGVNTIDVPFRFIPALIAGTAHNISLKTPKGLAVRTELAEEYRAAWQLATEEDRQKTPMRLVPGRR